MSNEHEAAGAPERAHSKFGGSIASRYMNCAGSVALCDTVPPAPQSKYAAEGTAAHALGEYCLLNGEREAALHEGEWFPMILGDPSVQRFEVTAEMAGAVQVYLDAVYEEMDASPDAELYVEQKFTFDVATADPGEVFGANDAIVYTPSKGRLVVYDYKHGAGVSVSVEDNAQLKFYCAGAALAKPWSIAEVELVIVQPRARDAETEEHGGVKRWVMDPLEILEFHLQVEQAVGAAKAVMARPPGHSYEDALKVGAWCRWCPAAAVCPAREKSALQGAQLDFAGIENISPQALPPPPTMDVARIAGILNGAEVLETWLNQVREFAASLLTQGVGVPGYKLIDKVGRRKWIENAPEVAAYVTLMYGLEDRDVMPPELVTITELERQLKAAIPDKVARKEALDDVSLRFTVKESSGLTLVKETDKREAVDAAKRDFGDIAVTVSN